MEGVMLVPNGWVSCRQMLTYWKSYVTIKGTLYTPETRWVATLESERGAGRGGGVYRGPGTAKELEPKERAVGRRAQ